MLSTSCFTACFLGRFVPHVMQALDTSLIFLYVQAWQDHPMFVLVLFYSTVYCWMMFRLMRTTLKASKSTVVCVGYILCCNVCCHCSYNFILNNSGKSRLSFSSILTKSRNDLKLEREKAVRMLCGWWLKPFADGWRRALLQERKRKGGKRQHQQTGRHQQVHQQHSTTAAPTAVIPHRRTQLRLNHGSNILPFCNPCCHYGIHVRHSVRPITDIRYVKLRSLYCSRRFVYLFLCAWGTPRNVLFFQWMTLKALFSNF